MRWNLIARGLLVLVLCAGALISVGAAGPAGSHQQVLKTPKLVSPSNGATFTEGTLVPFTWKPVDGTSVYYSLEIETGTVVDKHTVQWEYSGGSTGGGTDGGSFWLAPGLYRWRVTALAKGYPPLSLAPSKWRTLHVVAP